MSVCGARRAENRAAAARPEEERPIRARTDAGIKPGEGTWQRCHVTCSTRLIALLDPSRASEMTNFTPLSLRRTRLLRKVDQLALQLLRDYMVSGSAQAGNIVEDSLPDIHIRRKWRLMRRGDALGPDVCRPSYARGLNGRYQNAEGR